MSSRTCPPARTHRRTRASSPSSRAWARGTPRGSPRRSRTSCSRGGRTPRPTSARPKMRTSGRCTSGRPRCDRVVGRALGPPWPPGPACPPAPLPPSAPLPRPPGARTRADGRAAVHRLRAVAPGVGEAGPQGAGELPASRLRWHLQRAGASAPGGPLTAAAIDLRPQEKRFALAKPAAVLSIKQRTSTPAPGKRERPGSPHASRRARKPPPLPSQPRPACSRPARPPRRPPLPLCSDRQEEAPRHAGHHPGGVRVRYR
jgi:hypothetical protein